ncbi:membrane-bound transcription factor site-2 protease homolog isoform X2 [Cicer arietinum]|uniref:Endopeptidase S2P n=1 Tax=Cicer arietinum TaxID=3827 RepID=A0A1S3EEF7_CICAR|nr:membrane-bound transcription factor site-2 protease homolog isoform X2 [Cicer arietinum]
MEVETRRIRRFVNQQIRSNNLLPLHAPSSSSSSSSSQLSNTISFWYCDYKFSSFNKHLYHFGRRHANFFRLWFSIGLGFALSAMLAVTLILLWELATALHLCGESNKLRSLTNALLFGFPHLSGLSLSLADAGYICISTIISVFVHELGHAVAATSEGIQIEYIAVFIAVLFPGALVAFNYELLQASQHLTALRVYSAGIWHNAVCCAACGLALFLLPVLLFPFYSSGHGPMVLDVPPTSPLFGYLVPGDVIQSVDNVPIRNAQEWLTLNTLTYDIQLRNVNISQHTGDLGVLNKRKGYCVPSIVMEASKITNFPENQHVCPSELSAFVKILCSDNITLDDGQSETDLSNGRWNMYCLNAKDVVKLDKCGDGWGLATSKRSSCSCSQDEFCLAPIQEPGMVWVEITYSSPSHECLHEENTGPVSKTSGPKETNCGATFIFVGDVISMAYSIQLTSYLPHWGPKIVAYFPNFIERILIWTFHVSLALALLNGLPVYFLDGESILDATLSHFTSLSPRKRKKVLRLCLLGGVLVSIFGFFRLLL